MSLKSAAIELAKAGIPVFPCKNNTYGDKAKQPLTRHGFKDASTDIDIVKNWWARWIQAWLGVPTGINFFVIDVDVKTGDGKAELKKLEKKYGKLPKTRIVQTPSGGLHIYLLPIKGLKCSSGKIAFCIDIRAENGYVIVPPSDGYEVVVDVPLNALGRCNSKWEKGLLVSDKVIDITTRHKNENRGLVPEGQRLDYLKQRAGEMLGRGMQPEVVFAALCSEREFCCAPGEHPISDTEIYNLAFKSEWLGESSFIIKPQEGDFDIDSITIADLLRKHLKPLEFIIQELLPEGLIICSARPKAGKTRLCWQLAYAVATGGRALGYYEVQQGDVLFLALDEGSYRLVKDRHKVMGYGPTEHLHIVTDITKVPRVGDGFEEYIRQWMVERPDTKLIVVDHSNHIKPEKAKGVSDYDHETQVWKRVQTLAHEYRISIVLIHHNRKTESDDWVLDIMGSTALAGGSDTLMSLRRASDHSLTGTLFATGREMREVQEVIQMDDDTGTWARMAGTTMLLIPEHVEQIWLALKNHGDKMTANQIAIILNEKIGAIQKRLVKMHSRGQIRRERIKGKYFYFYS